MAGSLIETLSGDFDPLQYKDSYREALQQVIEAKVAGQEVVQPTDAQPTTGTVVDLMAALRASVEAAKKGRPDVADAGDTGGTADTAGAAPPPARKPAAKKAAAKKPASGPKAADKPAAKRPARKAAPEPPASDAEQEPAKATRARARRSA